MEYEYNLIHMRKDLTVGDGLYSLILLHANTLSITLCGIRCWLDGKYLLCMSEDDDITFHSGHYEAENLRFIPYFYNVNLNHRIIGMPIYERMQAEYGYPDFHLFRRRDDQFIGVLPLTNEEYGLLNLYFRSARHHIDDHPFDLMWSCRTRSDMISILNISETVYYGREANGAHEILRYIRENLGQNITLSSLCVQFHTNRTTLTKIVKDLTGLSPMQYVSEERLNQSRADLLFTMISLSELAEKYGFSDVNYYIRSFKKRFGTTPLQYRLEGQTERIRNETKYHLKEKQTMTIAEFETYLQKGLGRAILLLRQEQDKTPFREAVWNHAIHDPRYDRQSNSPRGRYIKMLFDCFPDGDAMLSDLFRYYGEGKENHEDRRYHMENLDELWRAQIKSVEVGLEGLYNVLMNELLTLPNPLTNGCDFERDDYFLAAEYRYRWNHDTLSQLVCDGVTLLQQSNRYDITDFTNFFDHRIMISKSEEFTAILTSLENERPFCKGIFEQYRKESEELPKRWDPPKEDHLAKPKNWREAIDYVIAKKGNPRLPVKKTLWQNLSDEDKEEIARFAEEEPQLNRRCALLSQLRRMGGEVLKNYPRDPSPLLAELEANTDKTFPISSDEKKRLLWEISRLTAEIHHPSVREFSLRSLPRYLEKHDSISFHGIINALMNNLQPEDVDTLEAFVTSITDTDVLHEIGMDLIHSQTASLIPETVLLHLYENNPCSSCRNHIVLHLMARYGDLTNLPEPIASIRKEAKFDCDYGTTLVAYGQSVKNGE